MHLVLYEVMNPPYVEGIFIDGYYKEAKSPDGYFTVIKLKNYTVTGNIKPVNKNEFIFDNTFDNIDNLIIGHRYRFYYSYFGVIGDSNPTFILTKIEEMEG